jgi:hypothetical protein
MLRKYKEVSYSINKRSVNAHEVIKSNLFTKYITKILEKKHISVSELYLDPTINSCVLDLNVFIRTNIFLKYNKLARSEYEFQNKKKFCVNLSKMLQRKFLYFQLKTMNINVAPLNFKINSIIAKNLFFKSLQFKKIFFNRRHNLFMDFIKVSALLIANDINVKVFSKVIEQIFKVLQKRSHNKFMSFLKKYFLILLNSKSGKIKGIKMIINGKLGGKPRSSTKKILVGSMPLKTISANTVFTKSHVYTPYGAYGLKLWIRYD